MSVLLGPDGKPASSYYERKAGRPPKAKPVVGEIAGAWSQGDLDYVQLPGGGTLQFDTSKLTLGDFRRMAEHPQISSSLNVLSFMLHQLEWKLVDGDQKTRDHCAENLDYIWTPLIRTHSSAFTFGYSANATQWENRPGENKIWLNKIKDLIPEEVDVNWKMVDAAPIPGQPTPYIKPKVPVFDGIKQYGRHAIPVTNSYWYPLLMKNNDYKGTKILRSAFQSWYFSNLIKLFANQYYERFGSPIAVGRAPYDEDINVGTVESPKMIPGNQLMGNVVAGLRNRSTLVLPNTRSQDSFDGKTKSFDYTLEYLESQMRGAEFQSYLTRLDEEMSLALFTPLLLLRTTDGGGFNQGVGHTQVFLWELNALAEDVAEYINKFILAPMARYAFGPNVKPPRIKFRKMGTAQQETLRAIVQALLTQGTVKVDVEELGSHLGLKLEEIEKLTEPHREPGEDDVDEDGNPVTPSDDKRSGRPERLKNDDQRNVTNPKSVTKQITARVNDQATSAFKRNKFSSFKPSLGFARQLTYALEASGVDAPGEAYGRIQRTVTGCVEEWTTLGDHGFKDAPTFMAAFSLLLDNTVESVVNG